MTKDIDPVRRELLHHMQNGKILDAIDLILQNLIEELEIISSTLIQGNSDQLESFIDKLGVRNDEYNQILAHVLADSVFLPFNSTYLLKVQDGLAEIIELIQAFGHKWGVYDLEKWIEDHMKSMIEIAKEILSLLSSWIENDHNIDLTKVQALENQADGIHRDFISKLYREVEDFKAFHLAEKLDSLAEEAIDRSEVLAKDLMILLKFNKISISDLPSYLR